MSVHDAREIRAMGQQNGIDIFGGNSLGVADAWNQVRIGGALGGDSPGEALQEGLDRDLLQLRQLHHHDRDVPAHGGLGHDHGDLQRQGHLHPLRRARVRLRAGQRRAQQGGRALLPSRAATTSSTPNFTKPVVACVVGRWKAKLTRAVGHAGAMAGGDDDAGAKERWFMEKFGVDGIFTPDNPVFSAKGAVVTNIAHIPAALTAVMRENATRPDFEPEGKPGAQAVVRVNPGLALPPALDLPVVEAVAPYNEQIAQLNRQIGARVPAPVDEGRLGRVADGCEDPGHQPARRVDARCRPVPAGDQHRPGAGARGGRRERPRADQRRRSARAINLHGTAALAAAQAAREAGNAPNAVLAAAACLVGPRRHGAGAPRGASSGRALLRSGAQGRAG